MNEILAEMMERRVDVHCSGSISVRGTVIKIAGGVLHLRSEDEEMVYVAIDKIAAMTEAHERELRAGFLSNSTGTNR